MVVSSVVELVVVVSPMHQPYMQAKVFIDAGMEMSELASLHPDVIGGGPAYVEIITHPDHLRLHFAIKWDPLEIINKNHIY